jgi:hypothetical protein
MSYRRSYRRERREEIITMGKMIKYIGVINLTI